MTVKKARVLAAIEGRVEASDRPPASVWYHFGSQFLDGRRAGDLEAAFFRHYDFDFLKMMNDYPWPLPDGLTEIRAPEELGRFTHLTMQEAPFHAQRAALERACRLVGREAFVIDTVFNPWGVARRTLKRRAAGLLREDPGRMLDWLALCAENQCRYIEEAARTGIGGIFYSINGADEQSMSDDEFARYVRPFDLQCLKAAQKVGPLVVGHVHGARLRMERVIDYPVTVFNWSHLHDNPTIADVRRMTPRCLMGGMDEIGTSQLTPDEIIQSVLDAAATAAGGGFMAGPGCAVPADIAPDLIAAPMIAVEKLRRD
ncbi:MAG TPA: uroporphyrinogen decarboxylase family protein [Spirochaetia bacterium]